MLQPVYQALDAAHFFNGAALAEGQRRSFPQFATNTPRLSVRHK